MYLGISIAFAAAACAEAVIQAWKAHSLRRTLTSTEEQLLAFEKSAKCMEASFKTVTAEKELSARTSSTGRSMTAKTRRARCGARFRRLAQNFSSKRMSTSGRQRSFRRRSARSRR